MRCRNMLIIAFILMVSFCIIAFVLLRSDEPTIQSKFEQYSLDEERIAFTLHNREKTFISFSPGGMGCWFEREVDGVWVKVDSSHTFVEGEPLGGAFLGSACAISANGQTVLDISLPAFRGDWVWEPGRYRFIFTYNCKFYDASADSYVYGEDKAIASNSFVLSGT